MSARSSLALYETMERQILLIRGQRVMLDRHLAALFGVETRALNQAVKRNRHRFPADFLLELTREEIKGISQSVTSSSAEIRTLRYAKNVSAFTEHGAIMVATILNSPRATEASVWVVRAFVKFRQALAGQRVLLKKVLELEAKVGEHDEELKVVLAALKQLMAQPEKRKKRPIGFGVKEKKTRYHTRSPKAGEDMRRHA